MVLVNPDDKVTSISSMDQKSSDLVRDLKAICGLLDPSLVHIGDVEFLNIDDDSLTNGAIANLILVVVDAYERSFPIIIPKLTSPQA